MIGIIYGVIAMLSFGISNFLIKKAMEHTDAVTFATLRTAITFTAIFIFSWLTTGIRFPNGTTWIIISVFGILGALAYYLYSMGMHLGMVAIVAPIANANAAITVLLAGIFLGEVLDLSGYLIIISIIIGIVIVSINLNSIREHRKVSVISIYCAVGTFILWGVIFFLYRFISDDVGPIITGFYTELMIFAAFLPFFRPKRLGEIKPGGWKYIITIGLLVSIAVIAFNLGIQSSMVAIVTPIASAASLVAVILGLIFYGERLSWNQYFGIALIIINIILLSMR